MAKLTVTTNKSEVVEVFLPDDWNLDKPFARASFIEEVLEAIITAQAIDDKGADSGEAVQGNRNDRSTTKIQGLKNRREAIQGRL